MEKNYLSDFGFVINDEENIFEHLIDVSEDVLPEYGINKVESATKDTNSIIFDGRESNQYEFSLELPIIDLDDFFSPEKVYEFQNNESEIVIDQTEYKNMLSESTIDLNDFCPPEIYSDTSQNIHANPDRNCPDILNDTEEIEDTNNLLDANDLVRAVKIKELSKRGKARFQRENGSSYLGYSKQASKIKQNVERPARQQRPPCASNFCVQSTFRQCNLFPVNERPALFKKFWLMNWDQKQMYICNLVEETAIKQRKVDETVSRRQKSQKYFLITAKGKRLQVCLKMFLGTFGLNEKMVRYWLNHEEEFGLRENPLAIQKRKNMSRQKSEVNQILLERKIRLLTFLIDYPKLESHYCRKDTEKEYFETTHQTLTDLYKQYVEVCQQENSLQLSFPVFSGTLKNLNFCIFKPRKDQCDFCMGYKTGNLNEEKFLEHRENVKRAGIEKENDVKAAIKKLIILLCMDVEGVVLCPKLLASALYFKSKLQLHNFTLYDILTHDSDNYVWDETEGDLQSSTFVSIIIHHLEERIKTSDLPITIYSDGCTYQNRNVVLTNALYLFAMKNSRTITQKFLEVGHTHMECDSTHACIDRKTKNMTLSSPNDFEEAISHARDKPFPLVVHHLTHTFFRNYDDDKYMTYKSIRPGKNKGDPKVTNIRCLQYTADGKILYKLKFDDEFQLLPQSPNTQTIPEPKQLHVSRLPVSYTKWKHLQELKSVIDPKFHSFYDDIPHHEAPKKIVSDHEKLQNVMDKIKFVKRAPKIKNVKICVEKAKVARKGKK